MSGPRCGFTCLNASWSSLSAYSTINGILPMLYCVQLYISSVIIVGPDPVRMIMAVDAMVAQSLIVGPVEPIQFERVLDVQNQIKVAGCHQSTTHAGEGLKKIHILLWEKTSWGCKDVFDIVSLTITMLTPGSHTINDELKAEFEVSTYKQLSKFNPFLQRSTIQVLGWHTCATLRPTWPNVRSIVVWKLFHNRASYLDLSTNRHTSLYHYPTLI